MSRSEVGKETKKRKRQDAGTEDVINSPKKSKKSKSRHATIPTVPVVAEPIKSVKKEQKERKEKRKGKKDKKPTEPSSSNDRLAAPALLGNGDADLTIHDDFIRFEDNGERGPIAANGTLSRTANNKPKKAPKPSKSEKKTTKPKQSDAPVDSIGADPMRLDAGVAGTPAQVESTMDEGGKKIKEVVKKKEKKSKEPKEGIISPEDNQNLSNGITGINHAEGETRSGEEDKKDKKLKAKKEKGRGETKDKKVKEKKKDRVHEEKGQKLVTSVAESDSTKLTNGDANTNDEVFSSEDIDAGADRSDEKKERFIVFVGNLPYSATKETIEAHFAKLKPFTVRMRTYKANNKFMGTCFLEFKKFDRMQTALQKYHHSVFPDPPKEGRKINVELSVGGGGNTEARKEKIKAKNDKLHDERQRLREKRDEVERKQQERKDKKDKKIGNIVPEAEAEDEDKHENGGIHPERLAMMQKPAAPAWRGGGRRQY